MQNFLRVLATGAALSVATTAWAVPTVSIATDETGLVADVVRPLDLFSWLAGATVDFNGGAFSDTWAAGAGLWGAGPGCGGVSVGGFHLGGCGDTFVGEWVLNNTGMSLLTDFTVNLLPIGHMFDRTDPSPGSVDSSSGTDFTYVSSAPPLDGTIRVLYSRPGIQPPTDLYGVMRVDLAGTTPFGGLPVDGEMRFLQDTDAKVPLPAGVWLLLTATGGLAGVRRLKRRG
jgi:hypothetical protein